MPNLDIGLATTLLSALVVAATAYLRLFVANQLSTLKEEMSSKFSQRFVSREAIAGKQHIIDLRLSTLSDRVAKLESKGSS